MEPEPEDPRMREAETAAIRWLRRLAPYVVAYVLAIVLLNASFLVRGIILAVIAVVATVTTIGAFRATRESNGSPSEAPS